MFDDLLTVKAPLEARISGCTNEQERHLTGRMVLRCIDGAALPDFVSPGRAA